MTAGRLLTLEECAGRTSTTVRWWRRAVFEGRLPVVHIGRHVRIDEADLMAFIDANRREARPPYGAVTSLPRRRARSRAGPP
jgi:excisionase family DNA binding protein